jgi:hypothetical protein
MSENDSGRSSRRDVLRRAAYIAPLIVTLRVLPSFAAAVPRRRRPTPPRRRRFQRPR